MIAAGNLSTAIGQSWKASASSPQLVGHRLLRRRNQIGGDRQQRLHLHFHQFRRELDVAQFSPINSAMAWSSVASSADGTKLVATVGSTLSHAGSGYIYTSSDSGANWILRNSSPVHGHGLDFRRVFRRRNQTGGGGLYGHIYTSSDSGASWVLRNSSPVNTATSLDSRCVFRSGTNLAVGVGRRLYLHVHRFRRASGAANWQRDRQPRWPPWLLHPTEST